MNQDQIEQKWNSSLQNFSDQKSIPLNTNQMKNPLKNSKMMLSTEIITSFLALLVFIYLFIETKFQNQLAFNISSLMLICTILVSSFFLPEFYKFYRKEIVVDTNVYTNLINYLSEFKIIIIYLRMYKLLLAVFIFPAMIMLFNETHIFNIDLINSIDKIYGYFFITFFSVAIITEIRIRIYLYKPLNKIKLMIKEIESN